jgi:hypothetical protein
MLCPINFDVKPDNIPCEALRSCSP